MRALTFALAFLLELCALAALSASGVHAGGALGAGTIGRIALGVAAPMLAAVIWGAFLSPRASITIPGTARFALMCLVYAVSAAALVEAGWPGLAGALVAAFLINQAAIATLGAGTGESA